jgi:Domain of unknown function (DUF4389)
VSSNPEYPVRLVGGEDLRRTRLTVLVRIVLVIPHLFALWLYGIGAFATAIFAWFAALVTGRVPANMHDFLAGYVRYTTHVIAYLTILADPYPSFGGDDRYEVEAEIDGPVQQNRLTVLLRLVLVLPCMALLTYVLEPLLAIVAIICWFSALVTGRVPAGLQRAGLWVVRFRVRSYAYVLLVNPRYPSFGGEPVHSLPAHQTALPPIP